MWQGDYHTHSTLDDGKSTLEEMAAASPATAGAPGRRITASQRTG